MNKEPTVIQQNDQKKENQEVEVPEFKFENLTHVNLKNKTIEKINMSVVFQTKVIHPCVDEKIEISFEKFLFYVRQYVIKSLFHHIQLLRACHDDKDNVLEKEVFANINSEKSIVIFTDEFELENVPFEVIYVLFGFNNDKFYSSVMLSSSSTMCEGFFNKLEDFEHMEELIKRTKEIIKLQSDPEFKYTLKQYKWNFDNCECQNCRKTVTKNIKEGVVGMSEEKKKEIVENNFSGLSDLDVD